MTVKPVPEGFHSITPYLVARDVGKLMEFLKATFHAVEIFHLPGPDGSIMHAEMQLGDSKLMIGEACEEWGPVTSGLYVYVPDVDATYARALAAGATALRPVENQFYGDRSGGVKDAWGNTWWISTHIEEVSPEEMENRMAAMAPPA
ncbi:MAG: VOC family protein [Gemmataceae bacterium]